MTLQEPTSFDGESPSVDALLDNSIISALLDTGIDSAAQDNIIETMRFYKNIGIPVVAYAEALYGIEFSSNVVATHAELHKHIGEMSIVPITENTVRSYLEARQAVPREKKRLNDTWIAASALEHDATILTGDADFEKFARCGVSIHRIPTN